MAIINAMDAKLISKFTEKGEAYLHRTILGFVSHSNFSYLVEFEVLRHLIVTEIETPLDTVIARTS